MVEQIEHRNIGQKYRVVIERSAVKGIDGFKVEANSDDMDMVKLEAQTLYDHAKIMTGGN